MKKFSIIGRILRPMAWDRLMRLWLWFRKRWSSETFFPTGILAQLSMNDLHYIECLWYLSASNYPQRELHDPTLGWEEKDMLPYIYYSCSIFSLSCICLCFRCHFLCGTLLDNLVQTMFFGNSFCKMWRIISLNIVMWRTEDSNTILQKFRCLW